MPVKAGYLLLAGGGAVVAYAGFKGHRWGQVARDLISGQKVPTTKELAIVTSSPAYAYGSGSGSSAITAGPTASSGMAIRNKALARVLLLPFGWSTGQQWACLDQLWSHESGWLSSGPGSVNPSSGAAGIPQDITGNTHGGAAGQILWGAKYIKGRYGTPCKAWAFWQAQSPHWY